MEELSKEVKLFEQEKLGQNWFHSREPTKKGCKLNKIAN
jgi:hypothetical protein